jgi:mRNA-degrading endonuclease RelE of RelBE toxin-antitoxin system
MNVVYSVTIRRRVARRAEKLPVHVRKRFLALVGVLQLSGPHGPHGWPNYSKLSANEYHCHLTHDYVACWRWQRGSIVVEVYYVGSREDAPY